MLHWASRLTLLGFITLSFLAPSAARGSVVVLIDLGNDSSFRGASVTNPDPNGNYWNSVHSGAFHSGLLDSDGNATALNLGFNSAGGSDYFNGPSGATEDPAAAVYDAAALGKLGVDEAVYDWYSGSASTPTRFQIQGLDPNNLYNLTFYGSKKFPVGGDTVTRYTLYTDNTYTVPVVSVDLEVGVGSAHNEDAIAFLPKVEPQALSRIYIGFEGTTGQSGYLNAMSVSFFQIPEPSTMALFVVGGGVIAWLRTRRQGCAA